MKKNSKNYFRKQLEENALWLLGLLAISYTLSLFANFSFIFDLFSHFVFQYAIGGFLIGIALLYCRNLRFAFLAFAICFLCIAEIYVKTDWVSNDQAQSTDFSIASYNRRYNLENHAPFIDWVRENNFDVIVLLEARASHVKASKDLKEKYPYQIHEPRKDAFGMIVMSKHPFANTRKIPLKRYAFYNFAVNVVLQLPDGKDVSIYAVHPPPPTSADLIAQRNNDMYATANAISSDKASAIIMAGDWNITPYSPYFAKLLELSGLKYEISSPFPPATWPSHFLIPLFQIPIDHVLSKGNIHLIEKKRGPAMGSDHYPVVARFAVSTEE